MVFSVGLLEQKIELPFEIKLQDFRLLKYPGSESPSSYESDLTIVDTLKDKEDDYNLFMNHVVDYAGIVFFNLAGDWSSDQAKSAGLDPDITILSVNHDFGEHGFPILDIYYWQQVLLERF